MGVSFHSAGCIKVAKDCSTESSAININSSLRRATKIQEKPAGGVTRCPREVSWRSYCSLLIFPELTRV
jgi:hypothetical protein